MFIGTQLSQKNELKQREKGVPTPRHLESMEMVDVTRTMPYPTPHRAPSLTFLQLMYWKQYQLRLRTVLGSNSAAATYELYVLGQVTEL